MRSYHSNQHRLSLPNGQVLAAGLAALVLLSGCQCSKAQESAESTETVATTPYGASTELALSSSVVRITPEQMVNQIRDAFDFRFGWADETTGEFRDLITTLYAVPLGGVDYVSSSRRDPSSKVQTLLISRGLAFQIAQSLVWRDLNPDDDTPEPILFKICNLSEDRPLLSTDAQDDQSARESEARFLAQVEDIYWRMFARAPDAGEVAAIKEAAVSVLEVELWPPKMWVVILYSLISSLEFWHL